jgi:hypothetical protein
MHLDPSLSPEHNVETSFDRETYQAFREAILLRPSELRWRSLDWQPSLELGFARARLVNRPVLLWAMNGHPLGAT